MQIECIFNYYKIHCRFQPCGTVNNQWTRSSSEWSNIKRIGKSHIFDVRDTITRNGSFGCREFIEERRWPTQREIVGVGLQVGDRLRIPNWDDNYNNSPLWRTKFSSIHDQSQRSSCAPVFSSTHAQFDAKVYAHSSSKINVNLHSSSNHAD